jgi:hypothetical protein
MYAYTPAEMKNGQRRQQSLSLWLNYAEPVQTLGNCADRGKAKCSYSKAVGVSAADGFAFVPLAAREGVRHVWAVGHARSDRTLLCGP